MAYNLIPSSFSEAGKSVSHMDTSASAESLRLWNYLVENHSDVIPNPLAFDKTNKSNVKIARALKDEVTLASLKTKLKITKLKMSWGDGSRGNRGTGNTGNLFEAQLERGLNDWIETGDYSNNTYKDFIADLIKTYNLDDCSFVLVSEGELNKKRPIKFEGSGWKIGDATSSNYDIGSIVTDLTLHTKCKGQSDRTIYLSLKKGGTTTMSNLGVKKIFPRTEIESGEIKNNVGLKVLETFGIDNERFCAIFNQAALGRVVSGGSVDNPKFNRTLLQSMIRGSIGYGYHYTHKEKGNKIKNFPMTKAVCDAATTVNSVTVYYGGKTGTGQRIDITVGTPAMELKFNIRDTSGSPDPWPDKLQSGYKFNMETVYSIPSDGYDD
jgi:hypothetical protein|tara:strand:+ start:39 stop:1181 length:1143 start_codon:yes stop_codon:yes gene_type:complete